MLCTRNPSEEKRPPDNVTRCERKRNDKSTWNDNDIESTVTEKKLISLPVTLRLGATIFQVLPSPLPLNLSLRDATTHRSLKSICPSIGRSLAKRKTSRDFSTSLFQRNTVYQWARTSREKSIHFTVCSLDNGVVWHLMTVVGREGDVVSFTFCLSIANKYIEITIMTTPRLDR